MVSVGAKEADGANGQWVALAGADAAGGQGIVAGSVLALLDQVYSLKKLGLIYCCLWNM